MSEDRHFISPAEAQEPFFAGIDLGGTNIKTGVVDDLGRPLSWVTVPTQIEEGPERGAERMAESVREATRQAGLSLSQIAHVGLGSPGTMDIPRGYLIQPVNLKGWDNFPIRDRVAHHCGLPVAFENDANAAAYGEFWVGAGREYRSLVLFTLGTGIGCGVIIGDVVLDGENSHGAECGHMIIDMSDNARVCGCGRSGHLEAYASATAVIKRTQEALDAGRASSLSKRLAEGAELTPLLVYEEASRNDPLALEIILDTARYMGVGAVNLLHTVDPNAILIGGAMTWGGKETTIGRRFLDRMQEEINKRAFALLAERIHLEYASLGGDAGFIGAAGVARLAYQAKKS